MKRFILMGFLGAVVLAAVGLLVVMRPDQPEARPGSAIPTRESLETTPTGNTQLAGAENDVVETVAQLTTLPAEAGNPSFGQPTDANSPIQNAQNGVDFPVLLRAPIRQVAAVYEAQSRFPTFSQPINSPSELLRYKPHQPQTVSLPFPTPDGGTYQATLQLDRYRYFKGDLQQLTLHLESTSGLLITQVDASVTNLNGDLLFELPLRLGSGSTLKHNQSVDLSEAWQSWPVELQWKVTARVGEQQLAVVAPFRYEAPVAVLEQTGPPSLDGEFLLIPLYIETDYPGYFFVQANLYSETGKPLAHLQTEGPVTPNHAPLHLKVSGALLRHLEEAGPYRLQDIQLERLGDDSLPDRYGQSREPAYRVNGYPLNDYAEAIWSDSLAQQRLEFLQSLGGSSP